MKTTRFFLMFTLLLAALGQADASVPLGGNRKGADGSYDMYGCMQSNDYYVVNFAAYQLGPNQATGSKNLPEAECVDLPATGKTQVSIDLLDLDVRKKPVALKILREDGQTIAELPMAVVKQGVLSTTVDFKTAGKYRVVLTVDDTDLHTQLEVSALHIPLSVALAAEQSGGQNGLLVLSVIIGILVAAAAYFVPRLLKPQPLEP
ncbi:hypothetical protein [Methylomonas rivi]|uniref:Uncharacterized protein n=1 Tax=Methylomonas rivi TaxID=2952226 RepID=A0ABT1U482_9GAMM|nr:hypothetical protein [Methylomonas sp. WSC-6]MCQ8128592.1 hypothetical protein [Methylomonas sp. WSC-6]